MHYVCFPYIAWNVIDTTSSQQSADDEEKENEFSEPITRANKQKKGTGIIRHFQSQLRISSLIRSCLKFAKQKFNKLACLAQDFKMLF